MCKKYRAEKGAILKMLSLYIQIQVCTRFPLLVFCLESIKLV